MTEAKFVVGDTLVTAKIDDGGRVVVTDGKSEWTPTLEQIEDHYTPVCGTAPRFVELVETKRDRD